MSKGKGYRQGLGVGLRLGTELIVTTLIGSVMGYALDYLLDTSPWLLVLGMLFGVAAGCLTVYRSAQKMESNEFNDESDV